MSAVDVNRAMRRASAAIASAVAALDHVRAARILFVYNSSIEPRARILPLAFDSTGTSLSRDGLRRRPVVAWHGTRIRYVVEYGRAFLAASPGRRLATLVHELLHVSPFFNGTLSRAFRHSRIDRARFRTQVGEHARAAGVAAAWLSFSGPCVCLKWRGEFSISRGGRYGDRDLKRVRVNAGHRSEV